MAIFTIKRCSNEVKQTHKQELTKLERQAEDVFTTINGLHRAKTQGASVFAYIFGCIAALMLGGGMSLVMLTENSIPALVGGIALGVAGIALCGINYFIYKKIAAKKTKQLLPVIDDNEEKLAKPFPSRSALPNTEYPPRGACHTPRRRKKRSAPA